MKKVDNIILMDQIERKSFYLFFAIEMEVVFLNFFYLIVPKPWMIDWFAQVNGNPPVKGKFGLVVETGACRLP